MPSPGNQYQGRPQRQPPLRHHSRPRPEINTTQLDRFTLGDSSQVPGLPTTLSRHFQLSLLPGQQPSMRTAVAEADARPSTRPDRPGSALSCWQHSVAVGRIRTVPTRSRHAPPSPDLFPHRPPSANLWRGRSALSPRQQAVRETTCGPGGFSPMPLPARTPASALPCSRRAFRGRRWEKLSLARLGATKQGPPRRSDLPAIRLSSISHAREPLR